MRGDYSGQQFQQPISWFNPVDTWFSPENTRMSLDGDERDEKAAAELTEKEKEQSDSSASAEDTSEDVEERERQLLEEEEEEVDLSQLDGPTPRVASPEEEYQESRTDYQTHVAAQDTYVGWARSFNPRSVGGRGSSQQQPRYSSHWPGGR
jgi:hypothetical protein